MISSSEIETFGEGRSCTSEIVRKKITVNAENKNQPSKEKDYVSKSKTELSTHEQLEDCVAAHLRSLRSDDPLNKAHPRSIEQELETVKTF